MSFLFEPDSRFWGPANVDWCEENYAWHPSIAEFHNTWSSLVMLLMGACGLSLTYRWCERRVVLEHLSLLVVGAGSALFHGTLIYGLQLMDELPMLWGTLFMIHAWDPLAPLRRSRSALLEPWGLLFVGVVVTAVTLTWPDTHWPMNVSYGLEVAFCVFRAWGAVSDTSLDSKPVAVPSEKGSRLSTPQFESLTPGASSAMRRTAKRWFWIAVALYGTGFAAWLTDRLACEAVRGLRLHAVWHILAGAGTFLWIQASAIIRARARGISVAARLEHGLLPLVSPKMKV